MLELRDWALLLCAERLQWKFLMYEGAFFVINDFLIGILNCRGGMGGMAGLGIEIIEFVEK